MSVRIEISIGRKGWVWNVSNVTPDRARSVPNIYVAERHDGDGASHFHQATLEHVPALGVGELMTKVLAHLPPPSES